MCTFKNQSPGLFWCELVSFSDTGCRDISLSDITEVGGLWGSKRQKNRSPEITIWLRQMILRPCCELFHSFLATHSKTIQGDEQQYS